MLLKRPIRRRGGPPLEVLSMFRAWLIQVPAGSYQFAVRVEQPPQMDLWEQPPEIGQITETFFTVLNAATADPERQLQNVVPDEGYRDVFLSLSRNLAPTGKSYEWVEYAMGEIRLNPL